jgi:hypothetical protein
MKRIEMLLAILIITVNTMAQTPRSGQNNTLTNKEAKRGWQLLFDGNTLNGWKGFNSEKVFDCWSVSSGELVCKGEGGSETAGDIITVDEYGDFELSIEWNISNAGNSGIFYHVVEGGQYHAAYETGPEYQLIDDLGWPGGLEDWQKTAADYAMHPANTNKKLMPVGEWNQTRIVFKNHNVEHWLNGSKVVEFNTSKPEWKKKRDEGKWKDFPGYAISEKGHIGLQNHGSGVKFRNIKIRKLD